MSLDYNKTLLSKKQLSNLTDERLNSYRKIFRATLGKYRHQVDIGTISSDDYHHYNKLKSHYNDEVLPEMNKRKHISK